jgi:hypothetical protein
MSAKIFMLVLFSTIYNSKGSLEGCTRGGKLGQGKLLHLKLGHGKLGIKLGNSKNKRNVYGKIRFLKLAYWILAFLTLGIWK